MDGEYQELDSVKELDSVPDLDFIKDPGDTAIAIPKADFLEKAYNRSNQGENRALRKYGREYDAYCKWSSLPKELRKPKTAVAFEVKWRLPKGQTTEFQGRNDFRDKRLVYFWDWMMDHFPDVAYSMYKRAVNSGKTAAADARAFAELIAKHIDIEKPAQIIQPIALVGVPQEKIERLFTPHDYKNIAPPVGSEAEEVKDASIDEMLEEKIHIIEERNRNLEAQLSQASNHGDTQPV